MVYYSPGFSETESSLLFWRAALERLVPYGAPLWQKEYELEDQVVFIMNLANKNGVKVVLAVDSQ